jgi:arylsulfatase A-like enzyme
MRRPNIIIFLSDDTDFSMLGFSGGRVLTPRLDALAAAGAVATRFHAASAVCTPSRYNYLTGRFAGRCPAPSLRERAAPGEPYCLQWNTDLLPEREPCFAQALQAAGYRTGYVGKWHCGPGGGGHVFGQRDLPADADPSDPAVASRLRGAQERMCAQVRANGFDYAACIHWGNTDHAPIRALQHHNLDWTAEGARAFLSAYGRDERPFVLYVCTTAIHGPGHLESICQDPRLTTSGLVATPGASGMPPRAAILTRLQAAGIPVDHRSAGALWLDDCVGGVLDQLDALGLADDTAVFYTTDHGIYDGKANAGQGGTHIPFAMRWPGRVRPGTRVDALCQNVDLAPTLLEMADARPLPGQVFDGRSLVPLLLGGDRPLREVVFSEHGYGRSVHDGRYTYLATRLPQRIIERLKAGPDAIADNAGQPVAGLASRRYPAYHDPDQLYDLAVDPGQQVNLARDPAHAATLARLRVHLAGHLRAIGQPFDLGEADPFLWSEAYRQRIAAARAAWDPDRWEWHRNRWY